MFQSIVIHRHLFSIDGVALTPRQIKDFWAMVKRSRVVGDCWIWQGDRSAGGHGRFTPEYRDGAGGKLWAHRVAFSLSSLIQVPDGLVVRHTCGLACCCNPAHLILGTPAQNRQDTREHRALAAALTDEARRIITTSNARTPHLAARFGVTNGIVWAIKFGKPSAKRAWRSGARKSPQTWRKP
jgi:hypothetical protein